MNVRTVQSAEAFGIDMQVQSNRLHSEQAQEYYQQEVGRHRAHAAIIYWHVPRAHKIDPFGTLTAASRTEGLHNTAGERLEPDRRKRVDWLVYYQAGNSLRRVETVPCM